MPPQPASRILVLDDDSVARRLLEASLTSEGYVVHTFGTMAHARAAVAREPYDLYLLDIVLDATRKRESLHQRQVGYTNASLCKSNNAARNSISFVRLKPDPQLTSLDLNGERMQSANTRQLIFDIPAIIGAISEFIPLSPGDVVLTGTPSGVGYRRDPKVLLRDGDRVVTQIERVGRLENPVLAEQPGA